MGKQEGDISPTQLSTQPSPDNKGLWARKKIKTNSHLYVLHTEILRQAMYFSDPCPNTVLESMRDRGEQQMHSLPQKILILYVKCQDRGQLRGNDACWSCNPSYNLGVPENQAVGGRSHLTLGKQHQVEVWLGVQWRLNPGNRSGPVPSTYLSAVGLKKILTASGWIMNRGKWHLDIMSSRKHQGPQTAAHSKMKKYDFI